jgi:16S rRNA G1207 methylase RsmC
MKDEGVDDIPRVKVKHIIAYLNQNFDPDSPVYLDKDGWQEYEETNALRIISQSGVFSKFEGSLFINN